MQPSEEIQHLKAAIAALTERVNTQLHHMGEKIKTTAEAGEDKLKDVIQDKPLQAVGIALAVGVLIGVLLKK